MSLYQITNIGCDDETCNTFNLTEDEYKFLNMIFTELNKQSYYEKKEVKDK